MTHDHTERLSAAARARMERDLPSLRSRVAHAPARRLFRQALGTLACIGLLVVAARALSGADAAPRHEAPFAHRPAPNVTTPVATRPQVAAARGAIQVVAASTPRQTRMLDDDELLRALAAAGRADGLVRIKGRTSLASELSNAHAEVTAPRLP